MCIIFGISESISRMYLYMRDVPIGFGKGNFFWNWSVNFSEKNTCVGLFGWDAIEIFSP